MAVTLEEPQEEINASGYLEEYNNGGKQSEGIKLHIAMTKNHAAIIRQLAELVPLERKKKSALENLKEE
jgi:hypothetical protein